MSRLRKELPAETALLGFCGAPWTVATYLTLGLAVGTLILASLGNDLVTALSASLAALSSIGWFRSVTA